MGCLKVSQLIITDLTRNKEVNSRRRMLGSDNRSQDVKNWRPSSQRKGVAPGVKNLVKTFQLFETDVLTSYLAHLDKRSQQ